MSLPIGPVKRNGAAVSISNSLADGQPQTGARLLRPQNTQTEAITRLTESNRHTAALRNIVHGVVHEISHETEKRSFGHRRTGALCFVGVKPCHRNGNLLAFGLPINIFNDRSHHLETLRRLRAVDGFFLSGLHALERQQLTDEV